MNYLNFLNANFKNNTYFLLVEILFNNYIIQQIIIEF